MTFTCGRPTATADEIGSPWENYYVASEGHIRLGSVQTGSTSDTASALVAVALESDLSPYECIRSSRLLAFWDNPAEDIYSFDDGEPV